jgi:hypothetical protein
MEKVYNAKLAVLVSRPNGRTIHWSLSSAEPAARISNLVSRLLPSFAAAWRQGVTPSDRNTPLSRASCSRVTGAKDPGNAWSAKFQ